MFLRVIALSSLSRPPAVLLLGRQWKSQSKTHGTLVRMYPGAGETRRHETKRSWNLLCAGSTIGRSRQKGNRQSPLFYAASNVYIRRG
jgi:hypothetical protein